MVGRTGRATIHEIAAHAHVSIATVSRVVNGAAGIRPGTRERVLAAIEDLAYVPNGSAQGMARRSTGVLGLVYRRRRVADEETSSGQRGVVRTGVVELTDQSLVWYDALIRGVEEAAYQAGYALLLSGARKGFETASVLSLTGKCDGIILMDQVIPESDMRKITRQAPVASIAHVVDAPGVTNVMIDNTAAMKLLIDHMVDKHRARHFAYIGGPPNNTDADARAQAVVDHTAARGVRIEPLSAWQGDYTPNAAFDLVKRRCSAESALPDVILCANDGSALGAIAALTENGVHVPTRVAVTGFDDMEIARLTMPPLTTIHQPLDEMARIAVEALLNSSGSDNETPPVRIVAPQLVVRRSCGCIQRARPPQREKPSAAAGSP